MDRQQRAHRLLRQLWWADVDDLTPLYSMTQLTSLHIQCMDLTDVAFLEDFTELWYLDLSYNQLTSLAPLVANAGIGNGDWLDVRNNLLDLNDATVQAHIQALLDRGVDLQYDE